MNKIIYKIRHTPTGLYSNGGSDCVHKNSEVINTAKFSNKGKIYTNSGHIINHFKSYIVKDRQTGKENHTRLEAYLAETEVVEFEYTEKRKVKSELAYKGYYRWWKKICKWGEEGKSLFNMRHKNPDIVFLTNEWYKEHLKNKK